MQKKRGPRRSVMTLNAREKNLGPDQPSNAQAGGHYTEIRNINLIAFLVINTPALISNFE